jgi:soluble lytic murein transglycosylase
LGRGGKKWKLLWIVLAVIAVILVLAAIAVGCSEKMRDPQRWFVNEDDHGEEIAAAAKRHGLDPELVRALVYQESRFKADKRGAKGEIGLMQILPKGAAAEWARVNKRRVPSERELFGVKLNLDIGCWYLARAQRRWKAYDHGLELALAEYNAGPTKAREWAPKKKNGEVIPRIKIASTKKYVTEIMNRYRSYSKEKAEAKQ